jgi:hypothetical protein
MEEQNAKNMEDPRFRDDIGPIFHSDHTGVHMRSTHTSIIDGVQQDDLQAKERFMRRYGDPCRCYYEATGESGWGFDHETAKDLAIEVLTNLVIDKLHSYHFGIFHSYLFESLYKHAIDKHGQYFTEMIVDTDKLKLKMKDSETAFKNRFEAGSPSYTEHKTIIKNIQDGDEEAKEVFIQWYKEPCNCYYEAIGECGWGFDNETAETLTREVLKQLVGIDQLKSFKFTRFRSYLFRILRNHAIDYINSKDVLDQRPIYRIDRQEPIEIPVKDKPLENSELGLVRQYVRDMLAYAIKCVRAEERANRVKRKAKAQGEKAERRFRDGGYIPFNVNILFMMEIKSQTSVEIANKINKNITKEDKKLTPDAVRGRKRTAIGRLRLAIRNHLSEEWMTDEEIDDEITDILSYNLSDLNVAELFKIGTDSPKVIDEWKEIANLSPQEIWVNISLLSSELGWKSPKTVIAQLLDIPDWRLDRWSSQKTLSDPVRQRIAALCELMSIFACGKLTSLNEQELRTIIRVLRDLADHADDGTVKDVISILKSGFDDFPFH